MGIIRTMEVIIKTILDTTIKDSTIISILLMVIIITNIIHTINKIKEKEFKISPSMQKDN